MNIEYIEVVTLGNRKKFRISSSSTCNCKIKKAVWAKKLLLNNLILLPASTNLLVMYIYVYIVSSDRMGKVCYGEVTHEKRDNSPDDSLHME